MDETQIDLREVLGLLRRQFRLIVMVLAAAITVAIVSLFLLKSIYSASALILIDPRTKNLLSSELQNGATSTDSARVESEAEILRSGTTLLKVIRDKQLVSDPEFGVKLGLRDRILTWLRMSDGALPAGEDALQSVLGNFRGAVSVNRRGLTYIIEITVRSHDPDKAADLANAVANAYISEQLEVKINSALSARDILQKRIAQASAAVSDSEKALDDFVFTNIDRISSETGNVEIGDLRTQLQGLESQREQTTQLAELIDRDLQRSDWVSLSQNLQSEALKELERQRAAVAARIGSAERGSQAAVDLQAELTRIEAEMSGTASTELSRLRGEISQSQGIVSDLRQKVRTTTLASDLPTDILTGIFGLQQSAGAARSQYQTLLSRLSEVETQADLQIADARIVSPALPSQNPSFPNSGLILGLAVLAGLGLGVGIAFLNEHYVGGFTSEEQVRAVLRVNILASIPKLKSTKAGAGDEITPPSDTMFAAPLSHFAESLRRVRAGIDQMTLAARREEGEGNKRGIVVMVCSSVPNEGKTTVSLSLARAYALSGQKTLLIDSDLRKPGIHRQLNMDPSTGLLDYLSDKESYRSLSGILSQDPHTGLDVIRGSRRSDMPTDQLLIGQRFSTLIGSATKHYDIVVLDTPPLGPVVDGLYTAPYADVIVLVVRWAHTSQSDVRSALMRIEQVRNPETSIVAVLNQQEGRGGYGASYLDYGEQAY